MKTVNSKKNGYLSDDDTIKYKINTKYFNNSVKPQAKSKRQDNDDSDDDNIRYKFPTVLTRKPETKPKSKIKVNFWSNKQSGSRLHNTEKEKKTNRRHTVGVPEDSSSVKQKPSPVKVRKRVSFLPSPVISENHVPMVTVPDDLTIQLNEEEAHVLREDLNQAFFNSDSSVNDKKQNELHLRKSRSSLNQTSPSGTKRKRSSDNLDSRTHGNDNELEFFTKYVVQKLRRMETNQRIYSENLINTVLMLGQLGKLNGKSKIAEV